MMKNCVHLLRLTYIHFSLFLSLRLYVCAFVLLQNTTTTRTQPRVILRPPGAHALTHTHSSRGRCV